MIVQFTFDDSSEQCTPKWQNFIVEIIAGCVDRRCIFADTDEDECTRAILEAVDLANRLARSQRGTERPDASRGGPRSHASLPVGRGARERRVLGRFAMN